MRTLSCFLLVAWGHCFEESAVLPSKLVFPKELFHRGGRDPLHWSPLATSYLRRACMTSLSRPIVFPQGNQNGSESVWTLHQIYSWPSTGAATRSIPQKAFMTGAILLPLF